MLSTLLLATGITLVVYAFFEWATATHDYFKKRGIPHDKPVPLFGSSFWIFTTSNLTDSITKIYNRFRDEKIIGVFDFRQPVYYARDPALVKQLMIKDFEYFHDRRIVIDVVSDPLFGNMLNAMQGSRWQEMRSSLSPAFTSSKMRVMFELISSCSKQISKYFCDQYEKDGPMYYDMKDQFSRYTNDVIATCAFGLKIDSLRDRNNEFYRIGKNFFNFQKTSVLLKFLTIRFLPKIANLLKIQILDNESKLAFKEIIVETMKTRERDGIVRPDMINLLLQLKSGQLKKTETVGEEENNSSYQDSIAAVDEVASKNCGTVKSNWSEDELVAQCLVFFLAGFETSSSLMTYAAYELAMNPEVQAKLIKEIDEVTDLLDGSLLTYDALQNMRYLDQVVAEALRRWPAAPLIDRVCVKDYLYRDEDTGLEFTIKAGQVVNFPIYSIQMDPRNYTNPEKFDPERFNTENKAESLNAYFAFGGGPRNCIGSRFALMEVKAVLYYIMEYFSLAAGEETPKVIEFKKGPLGLIPKVPIKLVLKPRQKKIF